MKKREVLFRSVVFVLCAGFVCAAAALPADAFAAGKAKKARAAMSNKAFVELCRGGTVEEVKAALRQGAKVNAGGVFGEQELDDNSPLTSAIGGGNLPVVRTLLEAGANVNAKSEGFGTTALMSAAGYGNLAMVRELLRAGAKVNAKCRENGDTALMRAAARNTPRVVRELVDAGADVNAKNKSGHTALMGADDPEMVKILADAGAKLDERNENGDTALLWAAQYQDAKKVRALLAAGAGKDKNELDAALIKAANRNDPDLLDALLRAGADANTREGGWTTPLMEAAEDAYRLKALGRLLAAGADVNLRNDKGTTALMKAASRGNARVVRLLLRSGADSALRDNEGRDALRHALESGYGESEGRNEVVRLLKNEDADARTAAMPDDDFIELCEEGSAEAVRKALRDGANIEARGKHGGKETPLIRAARYGNLPAVRELLSAGANVNARNGTGSTALIEVMRASDPSPDSHMGTDRILPVARALLSAGANVNANVGDGETALMMAAKYGSAAEVRTLLDAGADVNAKNEAKSGDGETALLLAARSNGDPEVVRMLLAAGANIDGHDEHGNTALRLAVQANKLAVVQALLDAGAGGRVGNKADRDALLRSARLRLGSLGNDDDEENRKILELVEGAASASGSSPSGGR